MNNVDYMAEHVAADLVAMLVDEKGMSFKEAIDALYSSETYAKLRNAGTNLYTQSPKYVFSFLENELTTGTMS